MAIRIVRGILSDGSSYEGQILLPHPFTFLTMKLFALRDRIEDDSKDSGRHHALDLYTVIGTMSRKEWDECLSLRARYQTDAILVECGRIVGDLFTGVDSLGTIRLRESAYFRPEFQVSDFLGVLKDLFAPK